MNAEERAWAEWEHRLYYYIERHDPESQKREWAREIYKLERMLGES